jgi:hypothetical protein
MAKGASRGKGSGHPIPKIEVDLELSSDQGEDLLKTLKARFETNMGRHKGLDWSNIQARLEAQPEKLMSLHAMEGSGGEPDVVGYDEQADAYIFCDCSAQSPGGRRSICYDNEGQREREKKGVHPAGNAVDLAAAMGIALLTEAQYRDLQALGEFDTTTSSWIETPSEIRALGGALYGDRRFDHIFVYHNGAASFYAARGFRGVLKV